MSTHLPTPPDPTGQVNPAAIAALDEALDALTLGSTLDHPTLDPDLLATATRLHTATRTPDPTPAFATALRHTLLTPSPSPSLPLSPSPARLSGRIGLVPTGRFWPAIEFAAMLLVLAVLLTTLTGGDTLIPRLVDLAGLRQDPNPTADIPIFRNDPAGAAAHPGPGPTGPAAIHWQFRSGTQLTGSPVIANGIIYVGAFNQRLYAIDAETGTEHWSFAAGGTVRGPAVANGVVYIVTGANDLIAVDATTGTERWRVDLKTSDVRPPTVVDGTVYLSSGVMASNNPAVANGTVYTGGGPSDSEGGPGSVLYAFDATTGQERWQFPTGDARALYAIDSTTGQLHWKTAVDGAPWGAPVVADGAVFISTSKNGPLLAMDADSGTEIWRYEASAGYGPVVVDGALYGANFALDPETGRELWRNDAIKPVAAVPAIVGDTAYLMTERGTLYAVDTKTGTERWHTVVGLQISHALSPLVTDGFVYVAASDGAVYALGDPLPTLGTPTARDIPSPSECQGARVDPEDVDIVTAAADSQSPIVPFVWPTGPAADPDTAAAITTTYRQLIACDNAGDPLRSLLLFSSGFYARQPAGSYPPEYYANFATPQPPPTDEQTAIRSITDIRELPDGRVGALTTIENRRSNDAPLGPVISYVIFVQETDRWLIDEVINVDNSPQSRSQPAPATVSTPVSASTDAIAVPVSLSLRSSATFSANVYEAAPPGSTLIPAGPAVAIDGILWLPVVAPGRETPLYVPATYLIATGARIPGIPVPSTEKTGIPHPSECRVDPIPLAEISAYMGPAGTTGPRSAMTYLATAGEEPHPFTHTPVVNTLRELFACHNAGSYTQSIALFTQDFFGRAGAAAYRPGGSEPDLTTLHPLPEDARVEILAISDTHQLDNGRIGVIVIGVNHKDPAEVTATYVVLAETGDRWLIDDAITIDSSASPGTAAPLSPPLLPALPVFPNPSPAATPPTSASPTTTSTPSAVAETPLCTVPPADLAPLAATVNAVNAGPTGTPAPTPTPIPATTGQPADPEVANAVRATVTEWVACTNAGEQTRAYALFTPDFLIRALDDPSGFAWDPDLEPGPATPHPESEQTVIRSVENVRLLPDGRAVVDFTLAAQSDLDGRTISIQYVLVNRGDRWLIDDATFADGISATPAATPSSDTVSSNASPSPWQPVFPVGATVAIGSRNVVLRALPRSNGEIIARFGLPLRAMTVTGPMADSGDALWLPVTDIETSVSGYVSLDIVLPPEHTTRLSALVGDTVTTTGPVRLRDHPETSTLAAPPLPIGTPLRITGDTISSGHLWISVADPVTGDERWVPADLLLSTTAPDSTAIATPMQSPTPGTGLLTAEDELAVGHRVTVTDELMHLRQSPNYDANNIIRQLIPGDQLQITGPPATADAVTWYPIEVVNTGESGYVVAYFLQTGDGSTTVSDERSTIVADYFQTGEPTAVPDPGFPVCPAPTPPAPPTPATGTVQDGVGRGGRGSSSSCGR